MRVNNLTISYCKKQIDGSFSCFCPVIDNEFCHNIVKVVNALPRGSTATLKTVKPFEPTGSLGQSLSRFPQHEAARSISTRTPGQDASPSQVTPQQFVRFSPTIRQYPFILLGGESYCEVRVKCLAQEHTTMSPARARTWTA